MEVTARVARKPRSCAGWGLWLNLDRWCGSQSCPSGCVRRTALDLPAAYRSAICRGNTFVGTRVRSAAFFSTRSAGMSSISFCRVREQ
jgi:hypothetical protein